MSKLVQKDLKAKMAALQGPEWDSSDEEGNAPVAKQGQKKQKKTASSKTKKSKRGSNDDDKADGEKASNVVYIGHLPNEFEEQDLKSFLTQFGKVQRLRISRSLKTGGSKGYGFVQFPTHEVATIVAEALHGYFVGRRRLVCQVLPTIHPTLFFNSQRAVTKRKQLQEAQAQQRRKNLNNGDKLKEITLRLLSREQKRRETFEALGIEYTEFPGYEAAQKEMKQKNGDEDVVDGKDEKKGRSGKKRKDSIDSIGSEGSASKKARKDSMGSNSEVSSLKGDTKQDKNKKRKESMDSVVSHHSAKSADIESSTSKKDKKKQKKEKESIDDSKHGLKEGKDTTIIEQEPKKKQSIGSLGSETSASKKEMKKERKRKDSIDSSSSIKIDTDAPVDGEEEKGPSGKKSRSRKDSIGSEASSGSKKKEKKEKKGKESIGSVGSTSSKSKDKNDAKGISTPKKTSKAVAPTAAKSEEKKKMKEKKSKRKSAP